MDETVAYLTVKDPDALTADLQAAIDILGTNAAFAYTFGDVSDASKGAIDRTGTLCAVTTEYGQVHVGDDYSRIPRIRVFGGDSLDSFIGSVL